MNLKDRPEVAFGTTTPVNEMIVDVDRKHIRPVSNILVRAKNPETGRFESCDIVHLERRSLINWLASESARCRNVALHLLQHKVEGAD